MGKIHDPNLDAMFRNRPQPAAAGAMNDLQVVAFLGAIVGASAKQDVSPSQAVATAIDLLAESILQMSSGALNAALERARDRLKPNDATALMRQ